MPTIHQVVPTLTIDGQQRDDLRSALVELEVVLPAHGMGEARVRLHGPAPTRPDQSFGWADLTLGRRLAVRFEAGSPPALFTGDITRMAEHHGDGAPSLAVVAQDDLHRLSRTIRGRVFEHMTLAQVVETVAAEAGVPSRVALTGDSQRWVQAAETDLEFLLRHVRSRGAVLRFESGRLQAQAHEATGTAVAVTPGTIRHLELAADVRDAPVAVTVAGWHLADDLAVEQTATPAAARPGRETAAQVLHRLEWSSARRVSQDMLGHQAAQAIAGGQLSDPASWLLAGTVELAEPSLSPGRPVSVSGVSPRFAGSWLTTDVTHRFDQVVGWTTRASLVRQSWSSPSAGRRRPS